MTHSTQNILFSYPYSRQSCFCVRPSLTTWVLRVVWPCLQPHSHFRLLPTHCAKFFCYTQQKFTHKSVGLPTTVTGLHLFRCSCLERVLMISLAKTKAITVVWSEGTQLVPSFPIYQLFHFSVFHDARVSIFH